MRLVQERRRDDQQWMLDWMVKTTGRVQNFGYDEHDLPPQIKSYAMIPKHMGKQGMHREAIAKAAERAGHKETAIEFYWRAVNSYHQAQHAVHYDDHPVKLQWYRRLTECYDRIMALSDHSIEQVEVPWEGQSIQCILHLLPDRRKAPTILFIPGMDMVKERYPDPTNNLAIHRGMNFMVMDGPGQGMSNIRKIRVGPDNYERAASAVLDYLLTRPEVDEERIGLLGASMGSFWGVRTAAHDHRIKAFVSESSCLGTKTAIFEQASPRFKRMFMYMSGVHDEEEFDRTIAALMTTEGYGRKITCPSLLVQGEFDPLSPMEDAEELFEELQVPKEMWILEDEFHGLLRPDLVGFVLDWLRDTLQNGRSEGYLRVKNITLGGGPYDET